MHPSSTRPSPNHSSIRCSFVNLLLHSFTLQTIHPLALCTLIYPFTYHPSSSVIHQLSSFHQPTHSSIDQSTHPRIDPSSIHHLISYLSILSSTHSVFIHSPIHSSIILRPHPIDSFPHVSIYPQSIISLHPSTIFKL